MMSYEDLLENWNKLVDLKNELTNLSGVDDRKEQKAKIDIARIELKRSLNEATVNDFLIFLEDFVKAKKDKAIAMARRKGNTLKETGRNLGEADAYDDINSFIDDIFKISHGIND
jgi:hypothetical protein